MLSMTNRDVLIEPREIARRLQPATIIDNSTGRLQGLNTTLAKYFGVPAYPSTAFNGLRYQV